MKNKILLILFAIMVFSNCSSITFQSQEVGVVTTQVDLPKSEKVEIKGEVIFYAWGHYPTEHIINIDTEFKQRGFGVVADPWVEEYQTFFNYLFTVLSFGMYNPRNFRITAFAIKESTQYDF